MLGCWLEVSFDSDSLPLPILIMIFTSQEEFKKAWRQGGIAGKMA
jgi:hypothetical protein